MGGRVMSGHKGMSKTILRPHFLKNCNSWLISQPREGLLPAATNTNIKIQMQMQMQYTTTQIQKYDLTSFLEKLQQLIDITAQRRVIASCNKYKYKDTNANANANARYDKNKYKNTTSPHFSKSCNYWLISQPRETLLPVATKQMAAPKRNFTNGILKISNLLQ